MKATLTALLCMLFLARPALGAQDAVARFALVAGNDRGIERRESLRYAQRDARRFAELLAELGGFEPERVTLLSGASPEDLRRALASIEARMAELVPARFPRALLLVYFSGHSDGVNLELGSERLPYAELRRMLEGSRAQVKIAFIDSCKSGGLTGIKGGTPGPAFDLSISETLEADGTAIVTSSSAGENSQESAEIQGSFFTHFLLSGLRGAADADGDRRVTLAEVYHYAYDQTVSGTAVTLSGAQHPTYEYQITGRGKVVLTELDEAQAQLRFGPGIAGHFLVLGASDRRMVAELRKPFGIRRALSLPAGRYLLVQRRGRHSFAQELTLLDRDRRAVDPAAMREQDVLVAAAKGGGEPGSGISLMAHYGLMSGALKSFAAVHQASLGLRLDLGPCTLFPRLSYGQASISDEDIRLSYSIRLFSLDGWATWRFEYSVLDLFAGLSLGMSYGQQHLPDGQDFSGSIFGYGGVAGIDVPLVSGLALQVFWQAGGTVFRLDGRYEHQLSLLGLVGLAYEF
ncbi:MAG: caspase family protein [Deltaproteobacteria bacterium]|nr:caspase family protein [Deltaproteobacteria bacterium]